MRSDAQGAADIDIQWLMLVGNYAERLWQSIDIAEGSLAQKKFHLAKKIFKA